MFSFLIFTFIWRVSNKYQRLWYVTKQCWRSSYWKATENCCWNIWGLFPNDPCWCPMPFVAEILPSPAVRFKVTRLTASAISPLPFVLARSQEEKVFLAHSSERNVPRKLFLLLLLLFIMNQVESIRRVSEKRSLREMESKSFLKALWTCCVLCFFLPPPFSSLNAAFHVLSLFVRLSTEVYVRSDNFWWWKTCFMKIYLREERESKGGRCFKANLQNSFTTLRNVCHNKWLCGAGTNARGFSSLIKNTFVVISHTCEKQINSMRWIYARSGGICCRCKHRN